MLTCIACSKQLDSNGSLPQQDEDDTVGTPRTKQAVKTITEQVHSKALVYMFDNEKCVKVEGNPSSKSYNISCLEAMNRKKITVLIQYSLFGLSESVSIL